MNVIPRFRRVVQNPKRDPFQVLSVMARVAWPVLRQCYQKNCCIAATRVGLEALKPFGIAGRPMPAKVVATNAARNYELVIDDTCVGPGYSGHLVIVGKIKGQLFLLDLSAAQLDRPERGINVPSSILVLPPPDFEFEGAWEMPLSDGEGGLITYSAYPNAPDFTKAPVWALPSYAHQEIFERMRFELVQIVREVLERSQT